MITINGQPIESTEVEYGVRFNDGNVYRAEDQEDAAFIAGLWGDGVIIARTWCVTPWLEVNA
jgi:hypothetical protein